MRTSGSSATAALARTRRGLRKRENWHQLVRFGVVCGSGYVVNLAVYTLLLKGFGLHYLLAATGSFLVAVTNNYTWNRLWTFRRQRAGFALQGARFFTVSLIALVANLLVLSALVAWGLPALPAQAGAIALVTPVNFLGNKLWSFRCPS